jgi:hypothetical protein
VNDNGRIIACPKLSKSIERQYKSKNGANRADDASEVIRNFFETNAIDNKTNERE